MAQKTSSDVKSPKILSRSLREINSPDSDIISLCGREIGVRQYFSPGVPLIVFSGGDFPKAGNNRPQQNPLYSDEGKVN